MKKYDFKKIDAFATNKSEGNPAGCIFLEKINEISDMEMLNIAKELKGFVSEVGYIAPAGENEYTFKYYSSERELDFCGHVTIAGMYDLARKNENASTGNFLINTNRGKLKVENRLGTEDSVFIMSPEPVYKKALPEVSDIAAKLKISIQDIDHDLPVSVINAGLNTLIVPIRSLDSILEISPGLSELKDFCISSGIDIIEVFTNDVYEKSNNYRTRVFAPTFGYIEDPATGSGNSAFGYYLLRNKFWHAGTISIEQNGRRENYNIVRLQCKTDENSTMRVWFGGGAVTRIEGRYLTYS